jgi:hypothetical protein
VSGKASPSGSFEGKQGLENIGTTVMETAAAEGLNAHKHAVAVRLRSKNINIDHSQTS